MAKIEKNAAVREGPGMGDTILIRVAEVVAGAMWVAVAVSLALAVARWALAPDYVAMVFPDAVRGPFGRFGS